MIKKIVPYFYIVFGAGFIILGIDYFIENKEKYRLLFGVFTENRYYYLVFRIFFGSLLIFTGVQRLKQSKTKG